LSVKRAGIAALGGLVAGAVLIIAIAGADGDGLVRLHSLGAAEWALPFVAAVCVGLITWWAIGAMGDDEPPLHVEAACPACGRPILDDWRLCPDCGTLVERASERPTERPARV